MLFDRQLLYLIFVFGARTTSGLAIDRRNPPNNSSDSLHVSATPTSDNKNVAARATKIFSYLNAHYPSAASSLYAVGAVSYNDDEAPPAASNNVAWSGLLQDPAWKTALALDQSELPAYLGTAASNLFPSPTSALQTAPSGFAGYARNAMSASSSIQAELQANSILASIQAAGRSQTAVASQPQTTNALSVLFDAIPSSVASSWESEFESVTSALSNPSPTITPTPTHALSTRSFTNTTTTAKSSSSSTTTVPTSRTHSTQTSHPTGPPTGPPMTEQNRTGSGQPIKQAALAGIISGLVAFAVLVGIGALFLLRRRSQGKPLFGRAGSQRSSGSRRIFPEVAWLYDPHMSRNNSGHNRQVSESGQNLIPDPRPGSVEMEAVGSRSPDMRPARPSSPLLAPQITISGDESPEGGRSRATSLSNARRQISSMDE